MFTQNRFNGFHHDDSERCTEPNEETVETVAFLLSLADPRLKPGENDRLNPYILFDNQSPAVYKSHVIFPLILLKGFSHRHDQNRFNALAFTAVCIVRCGSAAGDDAR